MATRSPSFTPAWTFARTSEHETIVLYTLDQSAGLPGLPQPYLAAGMAGSARSARRQSDRVRHARHRRLDDPFPRDHSGDHATPKDPDTAGPHSLSAHGGPVCLLLR